MLPDPEPASGDSWPATGAAASNMNSNEDSNEDPTSLTTVHPTSRQCPTVIGKSVRLITQRIDTDRCMTRQRELFHRCHRCAYRGQPANHVIEEVEAQAPAGHPPLPGGGPGFTQE